MLLMLKTVTPNLVVIFNNFDLLFNRISFHDERANITEENGKRAGKNMASLTVTICLLLKRLY